MKRLAVLLGLTLLCGCGRTAQKGSTPEDGSGGAPGDGNEVPLGVGPIDTTGQPEALPMTCDGRTDSLAFKLPCKVGVNFNGQPDKPGYHGVECELAGHPDIAAVSFIVPLYRVPELLNEPVSLPFDDLPPPPAGPGAELDGQHFSGALSGTVTFTQVDVDGRAFVARLQGGYVTWSGDQGGSFECSMIDGPLWAVAGSFI